MRWVLMLALLLGGKAMAETAEARAMWVVRFDITSPQSVQRVVETAAKYHFNALFVQVRGRGDAYYNGGLEPRAEELAAQPASFDPLQSILTAAHAKGMQVHAWLNTCYVWSGTNPPKDPKHIVHTHPDWLMADRSGVVPTVASDNLEGAFLDPGNPDARKHIHDVFLDVAKRYDVDGIHFDYVRYPNADMGFNDADLAAFKAMVAPTLSLEQRDALNALPDRDAWPKMFPQRWNQWRRDNVTGMVRRIYQDVKAVKPKVAVSAALIPWGAYTTWEETDAWNTVCQDWFGWMREGILDIAVPMTYHKDTGQWAAWVRAAVANRHKTSVWAGVGDWILPVDSEIEKIRLGRQLGAQGVSFFSYASLMGQDPDETVKADGKLDALLAQVYKNTATVPNYQTVPPQTASPTPASLPNPSDTEQKRW